MTKKSHSEIKDINNGSFWFQPQVFVWITFGIAALSLIGWAINLRSLSGQWGSYIPMAPITALSFLIQCFALFLSTLLPGKRLSRNFALAVVSIISFFCLIVLVEYIARINIGIDQLLSNSGIVLNQIPLGHMSPLTAFSFLLINAAIFILITLERNNQTATYAAFFAIIASAINIIIIFGYAFGAPLLYGGKTIPTALPTAIAFFSLGIGLFLLAVPNSLLFRSWNLQSFKGRLLRAFLLPIVTLVLLESWLESWIEISQSANLLLFHALLALVFISVIIIVIGITARSMGKSIEQSRLQILSLARFIEESPGPVMRFMRNGSLSYANSNSKILLDFWHCEKPGDFLPDSICQIISDVFASGSNKKIEVKCDDLVYSLLIAPINDLDYVNIYAEDITERILDESIIQQQNDQLQELNTNKDKFFSIIAHDLKAPFLGFLGLTSDIAHNAANFSVRELSDLGSTMHQAADNLFNLLHNLLEWTQMQSGAISLAQKDIPLSDLISKNIKMITAASEQKEILINNLITETIWVHADENMLNSVLLNLLSNAVKFTPRKGSITIRNQKSDNEMIEISISDTGIGISKNLMDKLFKVGEKTGRKGTEGELSTGLGLMLCKEFVEKIGGSIRVESEVEKGSTFYFTLQPANKAQYY